jgi:hypothetical protein
VRRSARGKKRGEERERRAPTPSCSPTSTFFFFFFFFFAAHSIIPARYGGPLAFVRDDRKLVRLRPGEGAYPTVRVFTAAGAPVAAFEWEGGRLAGAGWTDGEDLLFIAGSGRATLFDPWGGGPPRTITLGEAAERDGLSVADAWGDGLVGVTRGGAIVAVTGLAHAAATPPRLEALATCIPPGASVGAVAALPPAASPTGGPAALVAVGPDLVLATAASASVRATAPAPVTALSVSPCGAFVAAFTADGRLLVWASDFSAALSEFATQADGPPAGVAWCGTDAVLLLWGGGLALLVGPYGDWVKYDVPGGAALAPEPDGVRVVGCGRHDLVRRVPDALADAFKPGSTAPVAALVDARRALDAGDPAGHACLRGLGRGELAAAAAGGAAAACAAVRPRLQGACLKAAALGLAYALGGGTGGGGGGAGGRKAAADGLASSTRAAAAAVSAAASLLRVLRALAGPGVGWPLTGAQAEVLGGGALVGRLARRGHHLLALRCAGALGVPGAAGAIATHWATATLASPAAARLDDAALASRLRARLAGLDGVRYGDLAGAASASGRRALASHLLDDEPDPAVRVPLLLELGDGGRALDAAVRAADPGLIGLVLGAAAGAAGPDGSIPGASPPWSLADRARRSRAVRAGLIAGAVGGGGGGCVAAAAPETALARFLGPADAAGVGARARLAAAAASSAAASTARAAGDAPACTSACSDAAAAYDRAADLFAKAAAPHWAAAAADGARLRRLQGSLDASTGRATGGLSAAGTYAACVRAGDSAAAARVKAEAGLSERAAGWVRARAAAAARDWAGLEGLYGGGGGGGRGGGGGPSPASSPVPLPPDALAALARSAGAPDAVVLRLVSRMVEGPSVRAEVLQGLGLGRQQAVGGGEESGGGGGGGNAPAAMVARAARGLFGGRGGV